MRFLHEVERLLHRHRSRRPSRKTGAGSPSAGPYSVLIIDMFHHDPAEDFTVHGFPTLELAREFARRWVRDSLEELRASGQTAKALREQWFTFGEDAVVLGGDYAGFSELDFFIAYPATAEERDWKAVKVAAGIE